MINQNIALCHTYSDMLSGLLYYRTHYKDNLKKTKFANFHIQFSNSDFSVNIAKISAKFLLKIHYSLS